MFVNLIEYQFLLYQFIIAFFLSVLFIAISIFFGEQRGIETEKLLPYECGFDPFEDARSQFEVKFYLVAILFLIFDLEASFLFPWSVSLQNLGSFGFWSIIDFFFELAVGFFYAWRVGALEWDLKAFQV